MQRLLSVLQRRWLFLAVTGCLFLVATLFAFGHSLTQGFAPIDDAFLIAQNLAIRGPTLAHLRTVFTQYDPELYIPLTFVSFQANYLVSGLHPYGFHLTNILLHAVNSFLVFLLLKKLTGIEKLSLFAAFLFAVHPLQTEAVVWLTARKDLLSAFFFLSSALLYLRARDGRRFAYAASLALFLCALLSKVVTATLPLALLLFDLSADRRLSRKTILNKIPHLLLSILFVAIAIGGKGRIIQASHSPLELLLLFARSAIFSLEKFFIPRDLSPLYELSGTVNILQPVFLFSLLTIAIGAILCFLLRRRAPWLVLSLVLFLVLLSPEILTFHKGNTIYLTSDRYLYLPLLGILLFLIHTFAVLWRKGGQLIIPKQLTAAVGGFLIALLCLLSIRQTKTWDSSEILFANALRITPTSIAARTALARAELAKNQPEEAFALLKEGLKYSDDARLHIAAGTVYAKVGQVEDALAEFTKAERLDPTDPEPIFSMGSVEEQLGRQEQALAHFREALAMDPSYVAAELGIGRILLARSDFAGAEREFRTVLTWNENSADAHRGLAKALVKQGRADEAEVHRLIAEDIEHPSLSIP